MPIDPTKLGNSEKIKDIGKLPNASKQTIEDRPDLVTIGFEGLGICCFVESKNIQLEANKLNTKPFQSKIGKVGISQTPARCEVAIIRKNTVKAKHSLRIAIFETNNNGGWDLANPVATYGFNQDELPDDVEISIAATKNPQINGYSKHKPIQTLDRQALNNQDKTDLGWLIDIEGVGFHDAKLLPKKGKTKLSTMFIHNAEFYNRSFLTKGSKDNSPQFQKINNPLDSNPTKSIIIGHELGAKIPADKVQLTIKSKQINPSISHEFDSTTGKRYLIKISNTCDMESVNGDFDAIYEFLKDKRPNSFISLDADLPPLKTQQVPNQTTKPNPTDGAYTYVRFCGSYLASKQDGISEILMAQNMLDPIPTQ